MKLGRRQVFEQVEPPAGGLAGLRTRLEVEPARARRARLWGGGSAIAAISVAIVCLVFLPQWMRLADPSAGVESLPGAGQMGLALASLGLAPIPAEPVTVSDSEQNVTAVQRVLLPTDDVVFYLVASRNGSVTPEPTVPMAPMVPTP